MVGGFSESPMLRNAVERAFPNQTLIIPEEAGLAVAEFVTRPYYTLR
jgi:hypothetical protein